LYIKREAFGFDFKAKSFVMDKQIALTLCRLGIPMSIQGMAISFSVMFVTRFINAFGVAASAAHGAAQSIGQLPNILTMGLGLANSAMVGQNMGAGKRKRAQRAVHITMLLGIGIFLIYTLLLILIPTQMFNLFTDDPSVHELVPMLVITLFVAFPAFAIMPSVSSFAQGIGNTKLTMIFSFLDGIILRIGLSLLFGIVLDMGLFGFLLGSNLAVYGMMVPCAIYYFSGVWKKRKMLV
jgi:Na+-driven multidrug efflux pump